MGDLVYSGPEGASIPGALEHPAVANLRAHQTQLDADGIMVGVSRQALDELLALYDGMLSAPIYADEVRKVADDSVARLVKLVDALIEARDAMASFGDGSCGINCEAMSDGPVFANEIAAIDAVLVDRPRETRAPEPTTPVEPKWQQEAFAFLYGLLGGHPDTAPNVLRMNPEVRHRLHRAIYERKPRDEPYDEMMARLCPSGVLGADLGPDAVGGSPGPSVKASDMALLIGIKSDAEPMLTHSEDNIWRRAKRIIERADLAISRLTPSPGNEAEGGVNP